MSIIRTKRVILLVVISTILGFVAWVGKFASSHNTAYNAVSAVRGHWSATPGWPSGAHVVGLDGPLEEDALIHVINAQRYNHSLNSLSVPGQHITHGVANSIASLRSLSTLNLINCKILPSEAEKIVGMEKLQTIFVDPVAGLVLSEAVGKLSRKDIHILIRSNP